MVIPAWGADQRFELQDDGSVKDQQTGLIWAPQDNGAGITWLNALTYCKNYSLGNHKDWRMPTAEELATLYGNSRKNKGKEDKYIVDLVTDSIRITSPWVWTSRRLPNKKAQVFGFNYGNTRMFFRGKGMNKRALPVRKAAH
jgi:hypothetical protein